MSKFILLLLNLCCFTTALHGPKKPLAFQEEWNLWKLEHQKTYKHPHEEAKRHALWLANRNAIEEHNSRADVHGFMLKMNHLGDLTDEEYKETYNCYQALQETSLAHTHNKTHFKKDGRAPPHIDLPDSVDWRTNSAVSPVGSQGQCASCYAFSAVGALEGAYALAHGTLLPLSVQNAIDCSVPYGNHGCNGGNPKAVFTYVIDNQGIDKDKSYPYRGKQGQCKFSKADIGASQVGIVQIPTGKEDQLEVAVATAGPVVVAVDATSNVFKFYSKGVFDEPNCSTSKLTQTLLVIGYGKSNGKEYWLAKNSWGPHWGVDGYIMMAKGKSNQCGIATDASFPTL